MWPSLPQTGMGWTTGQGLHFDPGLWYKLASLKLGEDKHGAALATGTCVQISFLAWIPSRSSSQLMFTERSASALPFSFSDNQFQK